MPDPLNDYSINIPVDSYLPEHFCFSISQGVSVGGPVCGISCDTVLSHGTVRAWEACFDWEVVFEPPFDLTDVRCDTTSMNADSVTIPESALSVFQKLVGEIDGGNSLPEEIADLVYMVEWMFEGGPPPRRSQTAGRNGDGSVGLVDVMRRVDTTPLSD